MAHVLSITDGSTTITFASSAKRLLDYAPRPATDQSRPVVDSAVIAIEESTVAANIAAVVAINLMFTKAMRRRISGQGPRVFILWAPDGGSITYRSELYSTDPKVPPGRLEIDGEFLGRPLWTNAKRVKAIVVFSRRPYWEHNTLTQIPATNENGADDTAGLPIFNCNDATGVAPATRVNYLYLKAADIIGELEAPAYIEITHTFAASAARRFYIAHKAQGTPNSFVHCLEAEDASLNATYAASAVDADCSGGDKVTVTNMPATAATLATWTISATQAGYILSQWVKILARFEDLPSNATGKVRFVVQDSATTAQIGQSEWVTLSAVDKLQQVGTLILSPNLQGQTAPGAIKLLLQGKDSAAACDFGLDFIQLSPSEMGQGFRVLKPIDETLVTVAASTGVITDNMVDGTGPIIESRQNVYLGFGGPLMLVPGTINRLYFLHDGTDASAAVARTTTVKVWYRPRVSTVG